MGELAVTVCKILSVLVIWTGVGVSGFEPTQPLRSIGGNIWRSLTISDVC